MIASGFTTDPTLPLLLQTTRSQKGQTPASDHMPPLGSIEIRSKAFHPKMDGMGLHGLRKWNLWNEAPNIQYMMAPTRRLLSNSD